MIDENSLDPHTKAFLEEREEILKHKWVLSEVFGYDIGYEEALFSWIQRHRKAWRRAKNYEFLNDV